MEEFITKKSTGQEKFITGSQRDLSVGKGRFELISPFFLLRLAKLLERGAEHYGDRNWELGQPDSRYYQSGFRHFNQVLMGMTDEDHKIAVAFNIMGMVDNEEKVNLGILDSKLHDLPNYLHQSNITFKKYIEGLNKID